MSKQNITAWFFESGMVGIPKHILGLMEPLGLNFDDLGKIVYLLYCGTDQVKKTDRYAVDAAKSLQQKGILTWSKDQEKVDFSPMFDQISKSLGDQPVYVEQKGYETEELNFSEMQKKIEKEQGRFLSFKEKQELMTVKERYNWSFALLYELYTFYNKHYRRSYSFQFFGQMAFGAKVEDKQSLESFIDGLDYTQNKVKEVKKRLGHRNHPSEEEKECYLKWANEWKFSHEMVLMAVKQTLYAANPSFGYLDAILKNWLEKGLDAPEKIEAYSAEIEAQKKVRNQARERVEQSGAGNGQKKGGKGQYTKESYTHDLGDLSHLFE